MTDSASEQRRVWQLTPRDQRVLAILLAIGLVAMAWNWFANGGHLGRLVNIDTAPQLHYQYGVEINSATWPEFLVLPGIGEILARRVVESRRLDGPFDRHDQLMRVKGIGPKILERMQPYLLPIERDVSQEPLEQPVNVPPAD